MAALALDTLAVAKELRAAGFSEAQPEAVSKVVREAQDAIATTLATKADLQTTKADLEKAIAEGKNETLKWTLGAMGLQTVAVLGALLALVRAGAHP